MKRTNNLYCKICDIDVIMKMYDDVIGKNTKNKSKVEEFENNYSANIKEIKEKLITKNYIPGKYNIFLIKEPKVRIIMSQEIKDKIVNHLVAKYFLVDVFDKTLIDRNCATRINKGTHYARKLFVRDYNYFLVNYHEFYVLKMDISKYFYSLDHEVIKKIIRTKIKDSASLDLLDRLIDSTNENYINETINNLKKKEIMKINKSNCHDKNRRIKEINELPNYSYGKGACIGNMVSQIIATIYLDGIDKFIVNTLGFKHYARYMDDFYIMSEDKEKLKLALKDIEKLIREKYKLTLNNKTKIYKNTESIEFLGFVYSSSHGNIKKKVTKKTKKKFKHKILDYKRKLLNNEITFDEYRAIRDSYKGHLSDGDCYNLYHKYTQK